jgi:hypothetical protein
MYTCCFSIAGGLEQHLYLLFLYSWWTGAASISVVPLQLVGWSSIYICCSLTAGGLEQHLYLLSSIAGGLEKHLYLLFLYSWWTGAASVSVVPL